MSEQKRIMMLLSIVERYKGKKLIKTLDSKNIDTHFQCVGFGTAPTEMMDIFGLGSNDKDIIISLAAENAAKQLMADFGNNFSNYSEYGGLLMVLKPIAVNRLVCAILNHGTNETIEQSEGASMKNEHDQNLIFIAVAEGYADNVMQTAKKAGATGGTIIRGRLDGVERFAELAQIDMSEEREIICILAPSTVSGKIMEDVNKEFGIASDAHGILCAVPVEKAYKI